MNRLPDEIVNAFSSSSFYGKPAKTDLLIALMAKTSVFKYKFMLCCLSFFIFLWSCFNMLGGNCNCFIRILFYLCYVLWQKPVSALVIIILLYFTYEANHITTTITVMWTFRNGKKAISYAFIWFVTLRSWLSIPATRAAVEQINKSRICYIGMQSHHAAYYSTT